MIISSAQNLEKSFGGTKIITNLSFEIKDKERIGLVGKNGGGKTTILKLLAGCEKQDTGTIHLKKAARVGLLSQLPDFPNDRTVYEVLTTAFAEVMKLGAKMKELEYVMGVESGEGEFQKILDQYGEIQDRYTLLGGYEMESHIMRIAKGLQIDNLLQKRIGNLSGGEKTKIGLGLLLLEKPDLLLLDEPTNHLDIEAVEWLEEFINGYDGTIMIVSHDRFFLDRTITKIFDWDDGELSIYKGNYSEFIKAKEKRLLDEFNQYKEQQKKIKKMREAIKRLREWANQANPPNEGLHKRARNMERALERMEKIKKPALERKRMALELDITERSGKDAIYFEFVSKSFPEKALFNQINLHVRYQERVAIVGKNGSGKSTILKMILGDTLPEAGEIKLGSNLKIGYLSQHLFVNHPSRTVLEEFREEVNVSEGEARHILAKFLFYGVQVFQKVEKLSGGERMRLRLAQLMYQDINMLLLDEPTNHLDIDSREVLEEALSDFPGTILAVSHDRFLLNKLFDKTYWLHDQKLEYFEGNYTWAREKILEKEKDRQTLHNHSDSNAQAKQEFIPRKEGEEIEAQIEKIELEIADLQHRMELETNIEQLQILTSLQNEKAAIRENLYNNLDDIEG